MIGRTFTGICIPVILLKQNQSVNLLENQSVICENEKLYFYFFFYHIKELWIIILVFWVSILSLSPQKF